MLQPLPAVIFLVLPCLPKLLQAEGTMVRPVARPARIVDFPLALVLHVTCSPLGTEGGRAAVLLDGAPGSLHLHPLWGHLGVGRHRHHHIGWVHFEPYL